MPLKRPLLVMLSYMLMLQLFAACSTPAQPFQGDEWVIFTEEQATEQGIGERFAENDQAAEYWTPSENDVLTLEAGLVPYLQNHPDERFSTEQVPIWERLGQYNRQYIGIVVHEKKLVYANYFCDSLGTDWKKDFVFVMDGGDCFFQFKYDVNSGEFFDLQVNGLA